MSVVYSGEPGAYGPPRRVSFGWIGEAFNLFGANAGLWLLATFVFALLPIIAYALSIPALLASVGSLQNAGRFTPGNPTNGFLLLSALPAGYLALLVFFSIIYTPFVYASLYRFAVKQVRGEPVTASDIFGGLPVMLRMLGLTVLVALVGFVLQSLVSLIFSALHLGANLNANTGQVPSFAQLGVGVAAASLMSWVLSLLFYTVILPAHAMVADGAAPLTALRRSAVGMAGDLGNGVLFCFLFGLLLIVSVLPCGLGLLVTLPMLYLISALAYRDMVGIPGLGAPAGPSYGAPQPGVWPPPPSATQTPPVWGQTPPADNPPPGQSPLGQMPPRTTLGDNPPPEAP